jgi:glutamate racemase
MGGLTVMREIEARLPNESILYLADTKRLPYGPRHPHTVNQYALECARTLIKSGADCIVVACGTASAFAPTMQDQLGVPVIGIIEPSVAFTAQCMRAGQRIAILATEGAIMVGAFTMALRLAGLETMEAACPIWVHLAEGGMVDGPLVAESMRYYIDPLFRDCGLPDAVLLGCTHFPVLRQAIANCIGHIRIIEPAAPVAATLVSLFYDRGWDERVRERSLKTRRFLVTEAPARFVRMGKLFLGSPIDPAEVMLVSLETA